MSQLNEWRLIKFDPPLEKQYVEQGLRRVTVLGRLGSIIGALAFLGYGAWDLLLDPDALHKTGPIRFAVVLYFALGLALSYWQPLRTNPRLFLAFAFSNYMVVAVGYAFILSRLPDGFVAGVSGFILGMIFLPVLVLRFTQAIGLILPLMLAPIIVMYASGATRFELINAAAWIGGGGFFAIGFAYLVEVLNRRAFQLERSLERERQRSEALLLNILPGRIAERLKASETTIADNFASASVLFADIVGFTTLSARLSAREIVVLLNDLFSRFDRIVELHGAEKIKTIGDGYMVAAGVPLSRPDHAEAIAMLALDMLAAFHDFRRERGLQLRIRLGAHSGAVVAGVIGSRKFAYDLWGDTVNVASRMESHGIPDEIQISEEMRVLLPAAYAVEDRGAIDIKGHTARRTFILKERRATA